MLLGSSGRRVKRLPRGRNSRRFGTRGRKNFVNGRLKRKAKAFEKPTPGRMSYLEAAKRISEVFQLNTVEVQVPGTRRTNESMGAFLKEAESTGLLITSDDKEYLQQELGNGFVTCLRPKVIRKRNGELVKIPGEVVKVEKTVDHEALNKVSNEFLVM